MSAASRAHTRCAAAPRFSSAATRARAGARVAVRRDVRAFVLPFAFTLSLVAVACGSDPGSTFDGGGGDGGGLNVGDGGGFTCSPPCGQGQKCSSLSHCIPQNQCETNGDCPDMGTVCDPNTKACVPGGQCGAEVIQGALVAPNLLIVQDRSCSMTAKVGGKAKWTIAVDAVKNLTTTFKGKIRFGLTLFPDTDANQCAQGAIPIPVAPGNEAKIDTLMTSALQTADPNYPDGPCVTNIDTAVQQAATEPAFKDMSRKSYALLLTDGAQAGCSAGGGDPGTVKTITQMKQAGVSTFVIGFGGAVDAAALDSFAAAGGVPVQNAPHKYYDAADQKELDKALQTIASQTLGCTFQLGKVPPDPSKLYVFGDKVQLPRDPNQAMGWDYDPKTNSVTIYGPSCDALKAGTIKVVDIVYGCPKPPVN